jgi:hypothetical protein
MNHHDSFAFIPFYGIRASPGLLTVSLPGQMEGFCCAELGEKGVGGEGRKWVALHTGRAGRNKFVSARLITFVVLKYFINEKENILLLHSLSRWMSQQFKR